ncbi:MAG: type II toxin-antitoxin system RelE/ParE family toxin [Fimbriimonadaceae bacterium]|nr:type II toxin-antitoxin system RelE/ParE family toxin [Fimbriimonadaceae bacterium]
MPANRYQLSDAAIEDLDAIWESAALQSGNLDIADRLVRSILSELDFLSENPGAGHLREDLTAKPFRFWSVYSYLIVYHPDSRPLGIYRVFHGAMDVAAILAG